MRSFLIKRSAVVRAIVLAGIAALPAVTALGQLEMPPLPPELPPLKNAIPKPTKSGLIYKTDNVSEGYTLSAPQGTTTTYLIDNNGYVVHEWESDLVTAMSAYLLPNGNLLRAARKSFNVVGNSVQELNWDGEVV